MVFGRLSKRLRFGLCPPTENAVVKQYHHTSDDEGAFPIILDDRLSHGGRRRRRQITSTSTNKIYSNTILMDASDSSDNDGEQDDDGSPWLLKTCSSSDSMPVLPQNATTLPGVAVRRHTATHRWRQSLHDDDDDVVAEVSSGARWLVERDDSGENNMEATVDFGSAPSPPSDQPKTRTSETTTCTFFQQQQYQEQADQEGSDDSSEAVNAMIAEFDRSTSPIQDFDLATPEEEVVFEDWQDEMEEDDPLAEEADLPNAKKQPSSSPKKFVMDLPITEIAARHKREVSLDFSDVSSLSGTGKHFTMEFGLDSGHQGLAPYMRSMSGDIVASLERKEEQDQRKRNKGCVLSRTLIMLMDPKKRIFELVQVPYKPLDTTVGELLSQLPHLATDHRLARLNYNGLAHKGILISAPMVPLDVIIEAETNQKPLFAVPDQCSAERIEVLGNTLLQTPSVAQLLKEQLAKMNRFRPAVTNQVPRTICTSTDKLSRTHRSVSSQESTNSPMYAPPSSRRLKTR